MCMACCGCKGKKQSNCELGGVYVSESGENKSGQKTFTCAAGSHKQKKQNNNQPVWPVATTSKTKLWWPVRKKATCMACCGCKGKEKSTCGLGGGLLQVWKK